MSPKVLRRCIPLINALSAVGLFIPFLTACSPDGTEAGDDKSPFVSAAPVISKKVDIWDEFNGRVDAIQHVSVLARVSGYIERVNFTEGQPVKTGDILFTIDSRDYRANLQRASAELARAQARAKQTASEAGRAQKLVDEQAISTELWEQRQSAASQAKADVRAAEAAETQARLNLSWTEVRSPIDGRAGRAHFTVGNLVSAGNSSNPLTTVVSQDSVYVYFDMDETVYRRYLGTKHDSNGGNGLIVRVQLSGEKGYQHKGAVNFFDNQVSRSTGTINARAVIDNSSGLFAPGMFARVLVRSSEDVQALLIDQKAILTDQDRKYVYVIDSDGKAQRRDVELGPLNDGQRIVTEGLRAGDSVVVSGAQRIVVPGTRVRVMAGDVAVTQGGNANL